jgi:hypothetical protein
MFAAVVVVATAYWLWPGRSADGPRTQPAGAPAETSTPAAPVPEVGQLPAASPEPDGAAAEMWLMPDGTHVAPLNGATAARPLAEAWPPGVPYSPIVRIERSPVGVAWYVPADGSKSTTEMKWRSDLGRMDAVTRLARPTPAGAGPQVPVR